MASPSLIPNLVQGNTGAANLSVQNMGIQPIGNGAGSQLPGPSGTGPAASTMMPVTPISINPSANPPVLSPGVTGASGGAFVNPSAGSLLPANGSAGSSAATTGVPSTAGTPSLIPTSTDAALNKQATDEYGKGVGGVISSELENLGSSDSSYMQAYQSAMAMPNSEALSTLQTSLGNEGISGNSSTAALGTADLLSQQTSQEGLQEQQLLQSNISEGVGLTESLEGTANKDVSQTGWSIFGEVAGDIGGAIAGSAIKNV